MLQKIYILSKFCYFELFHDFHKNIKQQKPFPKTFKTWKKMLIIPNFWLAVYISYKGVNFDLLFFYR